MLHYTNSEGHKAIASQTTWRFKAAQPPGDRPFGAYFTSLRPCRNLCARLRIPKEKTQYVFCFSREDGLCRLEGGRGDYVWYSPEDYYVLQPDQEYNGLTEGLP